MDLNSLIYNISYATRYIYYTVSNRIIYLSLFFTNIFYELYARFWNTIRGRDPVELYQKKIKITDLTNGGWFENARHHNYMQPLKSRGIFSFNLNPENESQIVTDVVSIDNKTNKPISTYRDIGYLFNTNNTKWFSFNTLFYVPSSTCVIHYEPGNGNDVVNYIVLTDLYRKKMFVLTKISMLTKEQYSVIEKKLISLGFDKNNILTYGVSA